MKTVLITGANRGLGSAIVRRFAKEGYNVLAHMRKENEAFVQECKNIERDFGIVITPIFCDLSDSNAVKMLTESIEEMEKTIDVLVNNAGIAIRKSLFYVQEQEIEESFRVNYFAPVMITKALSGKMMRSGGGSIVNISSMFGDNGHQPGGTCYDASKAALNQFTRCLAQEVSPFGIRVNAVACGIMNTDMYSGMPEKEQKRFTSLNTFKRVGEPEEIANLVYWLTTQEASYVNGQIIRCDGGANV